MNHVLRAGTVASGQHILYAVPTRTWLQVEEYLLLAAGLFYSTEVYRNLGNEYPFYCTVSSKYSIDLIGYIFIQRST